ncbi:MAG: four helix bundle protein [Patescibacteria group bacterium]
MSEIHNYKDLIVWQKSILLVKAIYQITSRFPNHEMYSLVSQMRRAAVSIPSNIAEGYGRKSSREFAQFYAIAYGSALELETQLIICHELTYISKEQFEKITPLLEEVLRMLNSLVRKMRLLHTEH